MKATLQVLAANIRRRKGSFIGLIILVAIMSACTVTVISVNIGSSAHLDAAFEQTNQPQAWAWVPSNLMSDRITDDVESFDAVASVVEREFIFTAEEKTDSGKGSGMLWTIDDPSRYTPVDATCTSPVADSAPLEQGRCFLPIAAKQKLDVAVGDTITLQSGDITRDLTIQGFVEEPSRGAVVTSNTGFLFESDFAALYDAGDGTTTYIEPGAENSTSAITILHVYADDTLASSEDLKQDMASLDSLSQVGALTLSDTEMKGYSLLLMHMFSAVLLVFALILFIVSLLVIGNSISTGIEMDYETMGIQKALGFTGAHLRLLLVLQFGGAAAIGCLIGIALAIPLTPICAGTFTFMSGLLPTTEIHGPVYVLGVFVAIILYTLLKSRKVTAISPMRAISGGKDSIHFSSRATLPIMPRALDASLAVRAVTSAPRQYVSATLIVAALSAFLLLVAGLGSWATSDKMISSLGSKDLDLRVSYTDESQVASAERTIEKTSSIEDAFQLVNLYVRAQDKQVLCSVYGAGDDMEPFLLKGRAPRYDNEVVLTPMTSNYFGKQIGDTVSIDYRGNASDYVVSGIVQTTNDGGNAIAMAHDAFSRIDPHNFTASFFLAHYYLLTDRDATTQVIDILEAEYGDEITVSTRDEVMTYDLNMISDVMGIIMAAVYVISLLVGFVASLLICNRIFLRERIALGIYRSQGFSSAALRLQFSLRFLLVAFVGAIIGGVLVFSFGGQVLGAMFSLAGIPSFEFPLTVPEALVPTSVIVVFFMLFSFIAARKIKTIQIKELISE